MAVWRTLPMVRHGIPVRGTAAAARLIITQASASQCVEGSLLISHPSCTALRSHRGGFRRRALVLATEVFFAGVRGSFFTILTSRILQLVYLIHISPIWTADRQGPAHIDSQYCCPPNVSPHRSLRLGAPVRCRSVLPSCLRD
ncbi:hypothetical protein BD309DRAFT_191027 [Dichomitus squalens]|uniref:Uncharacterized protein n=1 Tax=Dichomitus squalens TaxID=114155 RepID=A0A4Q9Q6H1_9APHY|nr:hypothetical protein BD309DRAFT_191027 [Dichomitus squalens]TBU63073.1 hypothetical protein BD310DRAFT_917753 [Dichomitus squalens]